MKLNPLMLLLCLVLAPMGPASARKHEMLVGGDAVFKKQVNLCLDLLADKYPAAYDFVNQHIGVISQFHRSGMLAWERPPRYQMSKTTAFYSVTWCASTIAHDAYHSYLYQKFKPKHGGNTPSRYWADFKAEKKAIQYQIRVAKKIGASQHEIDYLGTLDGTHGDLDGDGKVSNQDYLDRTW